MIETERCPVLAPFAADDEIYSRPDEARGSVVAGVYLPLSLIVSETPAASRSDAALDLDVIWWRVGAVSSRQTDCKKRKVKRGSRDIHRCADWSSAQSAATLHSSASIYTGHAYRSNHA